MRSLFRVRRVTGLLASALILALAVGVFLASGPGGGAKTAEAGDLATMVRVLQSVQMSAAGDPSLGEGALPQQATGLASYFLKVDGIEGESTDARHPREIDVLSFNWGVSNAGAASAGGGRAGKASFDDFTVQFPVNVASPLLFLATATGQHIPMAVLTVARSGDERQQDYLIIKLTDVIITSYQSSGSGGVPIDEIRLNFSRVDFEYYPQKADGSSGAPVKAGYDIKSNKKV